MNYQTLVTSGLAAILSISPPTISYSQSYAQRGKPLQTSIQTAKPSPYADLHANPNRYDSLLEMTIIGLQSSNPQIRSYALSRSKPLFEDPRFKDLKPILEEALKTPGSPSFSLISKLESRYATIKDSLSKEPSPKRDSRSPTSQVSTTKSTSPPSTILPPLPYQTHESVERSIRGMYSNNPSQRQTSLQKANVLLDFPSHFPFYLLLVKASSIEDPLVRKRFLKKVEGYYNSGQNPMQNPELSETVRQLTRKTGPLEPSEMERIMLTPLADGIKSFFQPLYEEIILHKPNSSQPKP